MFRSVSLCAPPDVTSYSKVGVRCMISTANMMVRVQGLLLQLEWLLFK